MQKYKWTHSSSWVDEDTIYTRKRRFISARGLAHIQLSFHFQKTKLPKATHTCVVAFEYSFLVDGCENATLLGGSHYASVAFSTFRGLFKVGDN